MPAKIAAYVASGYASYILVDVAIDADGPYSIELYSNESREDVELEFDRNGNFVKVE